MQQRLTRNKLTAAVAIALGASAASLPSFAVNFSDNGLGEVGIVPYYTVRNGYDTNLSVVNTTSDKVVAFKIRFREGDNSRDARDFNVFLSPNDVWVGTVSLDPETGSPVIRTSDESCTAPWITTDKQAGFVVVGQNANGKEVKEMELTNIGYAGGGPLQADAGDPSIERAQEGHVEIIEMGTADPTDPLAALAVHGPTKDCAGIVQVYNGTRSIAAGQTAENGGCNDTVVAPGDNVTGNTAFQAEYCEPLNLLKVSANLITVTEGGSSGLPVETLGNFFNNLLTHEDDPANPLDLMNDPGSTRPNLNDASPPYSVQITERGPVTVDFSTPFIRGVDAVSSLFSATDVVNEYAIGGAANALTTWVVSFPTKYAYVDPEENPSGNPAPFENIFPLSPVQPISDQDYGGASCVAVDFNYFDREEGAPGQPPPEGILPSPVPVTGPPPGNTICQEDQTLQFGSAPLLGSGNNYAVPLGDAFTSGWMRLGFPGAGSLVGDELDSSTLQPTGAQVTFSGLPVTGFSVKALQNGVVQQGVLRNYGIVSPHAYYRDIRIITP
jgi:hypothetical protein